MEEVKAIRKASAEKELAEKKAAAQNRKEELEKEQTVLRAQLPEIKGIFAGSKKAKIEARLAEIVAELNRLE